MADIQQQIGERAQAAAEPWVAPELWEKARSEVLDLVRQYGTACTNEFGAGEFEGEAEVLAYRAEADALYARIAALVPTLPVQARDRYGALLWISETGTTVHRSVERPLGPWRPLLVATDAAPDGDRVPEDDEPVHYYFTELRTGLTCCSVSVEDDFVSTTSESGKATCVGCLAAAGEDPPAQPQPDILREVMEALGVDRAEDVLEALGTVQHLAEIAEHERDGARAEYRKRTERLAEVMDERDEARAEIERYRRLLKTQAENFAAATPAQDGPIVLRLPEVPPGTVALVGTNQETGEPGMRFTASPHHRGEWLDYRGVAWRYHEVLVQHEPLTVELAPEPEPQQPRTAAEVWRGLSSADLSDLRCCFSLAEALDREAGL